MTLVILKHNIIWEVALGLVSNLASEYTFKGVAITYNSCRNQTRFHPSGTSERIDVYDGRCGLFWKIRIVKIDGAFEHLVKEPISFEFGFAQGHNILPVNRGTEQYSCKRRSDTNSTCVSSRSSSTSLIWSSWQALGRSKSRREVK